jgi:hypothetical protein
MICSLCNATQANEENTVLPLQHRVLALSAGLSYRARSLKDYATSTVGSMADSYLVPSDG